MKKCNLCKSKEAEQTGSHITPAFLLSSQIGKRGSETSFEITSNPSQDYSENQGDKGIKEDYLFCRDCEKRLGIIETIYATEITQKIELKQFESNFIKTSYPNGNFKLECQRVHPIAFQLLIQSNIWRASISDRPLYKHFKVSNDLAERIRFNLDLFLPPVIDFKVAQSAKEWVKMVENSKDLFDVVPMVVAKAEKLPNKEETYEFFDNVSKIPYHAIINEYFIFLFEHTIGWKDDFFDFADEFDINEVVVNDTETSTIAVVPNARYMQTIGKIRKMMVEERVKRIEMECIQELNQKGIPVTQEVLKQMVIDRVNNIQL